MSLNRLSPRCRTVTRGVVLTIVAITLLAVFELNLIPATKRGFFCDDQTIRYPYFHSTIPTWLLVILFIVIPDVALVVTELCWARSPVNLVYVLGHFKLSLCMTGILTDVIKCLVGRLRPHFIVSCSPDVLVNMTCDSEAALNYITEYRCLNEMKLSESILIDAHKSFPSGKMNMRFSSKNLFPSIVPKMSNFTRSLWCIVQYHMSPQYFSSFGLHFMSPSIFVGHASLAMCSAVFIMCYTWRRAPSAPPHLGRLFLIFLFLAGAGAVCGSRVMVGVITVAVLMCAPFL